jgi:hypothetical protein
VMQTPPAYSAIKVDGDRAYDLARSGNPVMLEARPVVIDRLELVAMPEADVAVFEAECGRGTYVRALARDMGRLLGCRGHVADLRRTRVGAFTDEAATSLKELQKTAGRTGARRPAVAYRDGSRRSARDQRQQVGRRAPRPWPAGSATRARCAHRRRRSLRRLSGHRGCAVRGCRRRASADPSFQLRLRPMKPVPSEAMILLALSGRSCITPPAWRHRRHGSIMRPCWTTSWLRPHRRKNSPKARVVAITL